MYLLKLCEEEAKGIAGKKSLIFLGYGRLLVWGEKNGGGWEKKVWHISYTTKAKAESKRNMHSIESSKKVDVRKGTLEKRKGQLFTVDYVRMVALYSCRPS